MPEVVSEPDSLLPPPPKVKPAFVDTCRSLGLLSARYAQNQQDLAVVRDIAGVYEQMEDWALSLIHI